jgi:hypothetical protein
MQIAKPIAKDLGFIGPRTGMEKGHGSGSGPNDQDVGSFGRITQTGIAVLRVD